VLIQLLERLIHDGPNGAQRIISRDPLLKASGIEQLLLLKVKSTHRVVFR